MQAVNSVVSSSSEIVIDDGGGKIACDGRDVTALKFNAIFHRCEDDVEADIASTTSAKYDVAVVNAFLAEGCRCDI